MSFPYFLLKFFLLLFWHSKCWLLVLFISFPSWKCFSPSLPTMPLRLLLLPWIWACGLYFLRKNPDFKLTSLCSLKPSSVFSIWVLMNSIYFLSNEFSSCFLFCFWIVSSFISDRDPLMISSLFSSNSWYFFIYDGCAIQFDTFRWGGLRFYL